MKKYAPVLFRQTDKFGTVRYYPAVRDATSGKIVSESFVKLPKGLAERAALEMAIRQEGNGRQEGAKR